MKTCTFTSSFLRLASSVLLTLALTVAVCDIKAQSAKSPAVPSASAQAKVSEPDTWTVGANLPSVGVRLVGVFFPANGHFYAVGGRSADTAGSDFTNPFDYNPTTNTWTTSTATYPDNMVNNMACGVLTDATNTPRIYCVGGSAALATAAANRVFTFTPPNTITTLTAADNWPGNPHNTTFEVLPGGFVVVGNKLYIIGGFNVNTAGPSNCGMTDCMTHQTWVFDPTAAVGSRWTQKSDYLVNRGYIPTTAIGSVIYTAGGSLWDPSLMTINDSADSFKYNIATDTWSAITNIPRITAETRSLNVYGQMWVMGGGRTSPNPSNEVDIYNPYCNTWTVGAPFVNPRRNFPTDTDGVSRVWLAGGYVNGVPDMSMEIDKFPMATSAVSRKIHGSTPFDVPLPLNGPTGIECRLGPTYQMVVTFSTSVTVSSATVTCGTGSVGSISGSGTPTITVNLTGVTDVQRITVTLNSVSDGTNSGDIPISMGVLVGDTNANGTVNAADVAQTKSKVGQPVDMSNFREDVNANNVINAVDVAIVKSDVGHALP